MKATAQPSIYRNQSAKLNALYQRAGDPRKVLCVAFDFAKSKHLALICDGNGEILRKSFPVENNRAGIGSLPRPPWRSWRSASAPRKSHAAVPRR